MVAADLIGYSQGIKAPDQLSVIDVIQSCADFSYEKLTVGKENADLGQAKVVDEWRLYNIGKKIRTMAGYSLYAAYCHNQRQSLCLESEIPWNTYAISGMQFGEVRYQKLVTENCKNGIAVKKVSAVFRRFTKGKKSESAEYLAKWLKEGTPVSMGYRMNDLKGKLVDHDGNFPYANHESTVAAMRWNDRIGRCEFLLRNSWGDSCGDYKKEIASRCGKAGAWLTESEVRNFATTVIRIYLY